MKAQEAYKKMVDDGVMEHVGYLAARWLDESKYEDIEDYRKAVQAKATYVTVVKMTKRPFGFVFQADDKKVHVFIKKSSKGWGYAGKVVK